MSLEIRIGNIEDAPSQGVYHIAAATNTSGQNTPHCVVGHLLRNFSDGRTDGNLDRSEIGDVQELPLIIGGLQARLHAITTNARLSTEEDSEGERSADWSRDVSALSRALVEIFHSMDDETLGQQNLADQIARKLRLFDSLRDDALLQGSSGKDARTIMAGLAQQISAMDMRKLAVPLIGAGSGRLAGARVGEMLSVLGSHPHLHTVVFVRQTAVASILEAHPEEKLEEHAQAPFQIFTHEAEELLATAS